MGERDELARGVVGIMELKAENERLKALNAELEGALRNIQQRSNEHGAASSAGSLTDAYLETIHAMAGIARAALTKAESEAS